MATTETSKPTPKLTKPAPRRRCTECGKPVIWGALGDGSEKQCVICA